MQSKKVFIASDVLFAFIDRAHPKHREAAAFFRFFAENKYQLFTDILNVYDTYNLINDEMSITVAKDFIRILGLSNITILYPDESDMKAALKVFQNDKNTDLTLKKCIMAVLSDRKSIPQIATYEYMHTIFGLSMFYIPL